MTISKAKEKANRKWDDKNKERVSYLKKRSACKLFIKIAEPEDLLEIQRLVKERLHEKEDSSAPDAEKDKR